MLSTEILFHVEQFRVFRPATNLVGNVPRGTFSFLKEANLGCELGTQAIGDNSRLTARSGQLAESYSSIVESEAGDPSPELAILIVRVLIESRRSRVRCGRLAIPACEPFAAFVRSSQLL